jgi:hypothetical protein
LGEISIKSPPGSGLRRAIHAASTAAVSSGSSPEDSEGAFLEVDVGEIDAHDLGVPEPQVIEQARQRDVAGRLDEAPDLVDRGPARLAGGPGRPH